VSPSGAIDLLLLDATIHTLDQAHGVVQALAVAAGRVAAVGTTEAMQSLRAAGTQVVHLGGKTVLPGLIDAHLHLEHLALSLTQVDCDTSTLGECLARVGQRASAAPSGAWILGHGWDQNRWGDFPDRRSLDSVSSGHPVYLTAKSLHAGWANSMALSQAGLERQALDPPGGALRRDALGDLTGIVVEGAMELVSRAIPRPNIEDTLAAMEASQAILWRYGLTGVHDFDGPSCFQALQLMRERGRLGLRVLKSLPLELLDSAAALGLRSGFGDAWLRIGAVKAFADGALGPRTAAMLAPYEGEPENRGTCLQDRESLFDIGRRAFASGLSLAVHAIGDRANHETLAAFAALRREPSAGAPPAMPSRIEHAQLLHPDDISMLAGLGLVASMQPIHATSDMLMADRYWGSRARTSYAWRSLEAAGTILAFGSDAPVESPNPFWGLHAAVTRRRHDGSPGPEGWIPEQRLARESALRAFTGAPASLAGLAGRQGILAPGAFADLVVLDDDPLTCDEDLLFALCPRGTLVDGTWRYRDF
jgi:predicted amidohydrolase YtcJ